MVLTYDMAPVKKTKAIGNYLTAEDTVVNVPITQVMVSGASDLERLSNYPPTTIAYTAGYNKIWQKGIDGTWVEVGEEEI